MDRIDTITAALPGWCTTHKARKLFELASLEQCLLAVEIGVYGGRSLMPVALAFAEKKAGRIYAVDPWDNEIAIETKTSHENDQWWSSVDLQRIKRDFIEFLISSDLLKHTKLVELSSDDAITIFQSPRFRGQIDLLHIDGSHSLVQAITDTVLWLKLVKPGGHMVIDDINWPSVQPAFEFLREAADIVHMSEDEERGHFAVFAKRST